MRGMTLERFIQNGAGEQSSKRVIPKEEKKTDRILQCDYNKTSATVLTETLENQGEGEKGCTDRKYYYSTLYDTALNNAYSNISSEYRFKQNLWSLG